MSRVSAHVRAFHVAVAITIASVLWFLWRRGSASLSSLEFAIVVVLQLIALVLVNDGAQKIVAACYARAEGFAEEAAVGVGDVLLPSLDRIITLMHADDHGGAPEMEEANISAERYKDLDGAALGALQLQYKKLGFWFCQLRFTAPDTYAALMRVCGAKAPTLAKDDDDAGGPEDSGGDA